MRIRNVCGDERGYGTLVLGPGETHDIDDSAMAEWFLRHGCVDADLDDGDSPNVDDGGTPNVESETEEDSSYLDNLRGKAREAGIAHWWMKSAVTLTKELAELEEG